MNETSSAKKPAKPRNPHPEMHAPITNLTLEQQIALAERAVIARDERIRARTDDIFRRTKRDVLRHAGGGIAVGLATLGLTWWFNRRHAAAVKAAAPPPAPEPTEGEKLLRDAGLTLAGLLPLVWPMMPRAVRRSVSPGMAGSVLSFAAPWIAKLFRRRPKEPSFR